MWAQVVDGQVVSVSLDSPLEGWSEVTPTARPMDTEAATWDSGVEVVDGLPVQTWTSRPWRDGELSDEYRAVLQVRDVRNEYAELIPGAIESFRIAKLKAGADYATVEAETSGKRPLDMGALQADLEAWTPSGVTADDLDALRDFMVQIVACRYWTWDAMYAGEVYGRALWGIAPAE